MLSKRLILFMFLALFYTRIRVSMWCSVDQAELTVVLVDRYRLSILFPYLFIFVYFSDYPSVLITRDPILGVLRSLVFDYNRGNLYMTKTRWVTLSNRLMEHLLFIHNYIIHPISLTTWSCPILYLTPPFNSWLLG